LIRPSYQVHALSLDGIVVAGDGQRFCANAVAGQEQTKFRGRERVGWAFTFAAAAYNLTRLPKLIAAPA
jgi:hypothetical protein